MIHDLDKTADQLLSDSAFDTLAFVEAKIAEVQAQLGELKEDGRELTYDSFEYRYNWEGQREAHGQLLALAMVQGHLQGVTRIKCILADCRRSGEASQEVA